MGFKPGFGVVSIDGVFPLAPTFDHVGPMSPDVAGCAELMSALVPGLHLTDALDARVRHAWADDCAPLVRGRVLEAAAIFGATPVDVPTAEAVGPAFMREIGDVHRDLYPKHAELYGENVRGKMERCIEVGDAEYEKAVAARGELGERFEEALVGADLL